MAWGKFKKALQIKPRAAPTAPQAPVSKPDPLARVGPDGKKISYSLKEELEHGRQKRQWIAQEEQKIRSLVNGKTVREIQQLQEEGKVPKNFRRA
jgi:hypothetical protein